MARWLAIVLLWGAAATTARAEEAAAPVLTDDQMTVRTEANHNLLLPRDWPIQQKDGQLGPVPVEAYLSMKFGQVRGKFQASDTQLAALAERVKILEADRQALLIRVKALEDRVAQLEDSAHGAQAQNR